MHKATRVNMSRCSKHFDFFLMVYCRVRLFPLESRDILSCIIDVSHKGREEARDGLLYCPHGSAPLFAEPYIMVFCVCVCLLPSHLFWTSDLWTYQPGSQDAAAELGRNPVSKHQI